MMLRMSQDDAWDHFREAQYLIKMAELQLRDAETKLHLISIDLAQKTSHHRENLRRILEDLEEDMRVLKEIL